MPLANISNILLVNTISCFSLSPLQVLTLLPLYLVSLGGVLNYDGYCLYTYYTHGSSKVDYQDFLWVEFVGGLGALILCVSEVP